MTNSLNIILKLLTIITLGALPIVGQVSDSGDESVARAKEIVRDFYAATQCAFPGRPPENILIKYNEIWTVNNRDVASMKSLYSSGQLLRSEDKNVPGAADYSRTAVLTELGFYREYATATAGVATKKLDLSKKENVNDSEVKSIKRDAFTILFPITLNAPWYQTINLRYAGLAETKDKKAYVLEGDRGPNTQIKLLFDTTSKLLIMWKLSGKSSDGKLKTYDYYLTEYKQFSGCKLPRVIQSFDDQKLSTRMEIEDFQRYVKFDSKIFAIKD